MKFIDTWGRPLRRASDAGAIARPLAKREPLTREPAAPGPGRDCALLKTTDVYGEKAPERFYCWTHGLALTPQGDLDPVPLMKSPGRPWLPPEDLTKVDEPTARVIRLMNAAKPFDERDEIDELNRKGLLKKIARGEMPEGQRWRAQCCIARFLGASREWRAAAFAKMDRAWHKAYELDFDPHVDGTPSQADELAKALNSAGMSVADFTKFVEENAPTHRREKERLATDRPLLK